MSLNNKKRKKTFDVSESIQKGNKMFKKTVTNFSSDNKRSSLNEHLKKLINEVLDESEYTLNKVKQLEGKKFEEFLSENQGKRFDIKEMIAFQEKQEDFGNEDGSVNFILNKKTNEISTKISEEKLTKKYVFKKLRNNEMEGFYSYAVFIQSMTSDNTDEKILYALSHSFKNEDVTEKINILSDFITKIKTEGLI
jgi:hypothetical protein